MERDAYDGGRGGLQSPASNVAGKTHENGIRLGQLSLCSAFSHSVE